MLRRLYSPFCNAVDLLSTKSMRRFKDGQFPSSLLYSRPYRSSLVIAELSMTSNGIRVATEKMASKIANITVFINCGSRNQTPETSGTAHFLEHLHFKGTTKRLRTQLQLQVQNIGANLNAYTSRQNTSNHVAQGISIIGDMITNSLYRVQDVENERSTIHRELLETRKSMPLETTLEIAHKGIFSEQQIGLPILGDISNMETISRQMIVNYHNENYVGDHIIVTAVGDLNHDELVAAVEKYITVPARNAHPRAQIAKPVFTPGISYLSSDLTENVNVVTVHEAPSFFDNEFFAYLLLQRLVADRPQNDFELEIMKNSESFRYQKEMAQYDFIYKQKGFFSSYWDTGLYGNYFLCKPDKCFETIRNSFKAYENYSKNIKDEELERAKRKVYVQILQHQNQNDIAQSLANNLMYYNRKVHNKELAERVACVTVRQLQDIATRIFQSREHMHVTIWGNIGAVPELSAPSQ